MRSAVVVPKIHANTLEALGKVTREVTVPKSVVEPVFDLEPDDDDDDDDDDEEEEDDDLVAALSILRRTE